MGVVNDNVAGGKIGVSRRLNRSYASRAIWSCTALPNALSLITRWKIYSLTSSRSMDLNGVS
jgi:hypothetical protein